MSYIRRRKNQLVLQHGAANASGTPAVPKRQRTNTWVRPTAPTSNKTISVSTTATNNKTSTSEPQRYTKQNRLSIVRTAPAAAAPMTSTPPAKPRYTVSRLHLRRLSSSTPATARSRPRMPRLRPRLSARATVQQQQPHQSGPSLRGPARRRPKAAAVNQAAARATLHAAAAPNKLVRVGSKMYAASSTRSGRSATLVLQSHQVLNRC